MSDFTIVGDLIIQGDGNDVINQLTQNMNLAQSSGDALGSTMSNLGNIIDYAIGTLAARAVENLIGLFGQLATSGAQLGAQEEVTLARLNQTLISTGDSAGMTSQQELALANSLRDLAGGSTQAVLASELVLDRFHNISSTVFPDAVKASLDIAVALGTTTAQAARQLGMALEEPGFGMTRLMNMLGSQLLPSQRRAVEALTLTGQAAAAQKLMLDQLSEAVGGQAAAAADTFSGKWAILGGHFQQFAAIMTTQFFPVLEHLMDVVTPILDQFYQSFENTFLPLITEASAWGEAIINQFAMGMQSAVQQVVDVINEIGAAIASLMAPGSPPKFLPLLDVWGREAVDVYLKGWTTFDKSTFDEIGKAIKAGLPSTEIFQYANTMHQLYDANQAVETAQDALTAATAKYKAILDPLDERLQRLTNQQTKLADQEKIAALENVAHSTFYSDNERQQALLEIKRIKIKEQIDAVNLQKNTEENHDKAVLTAAQQHQKDIAEQAKLLKDQIDVQAQLTDHINQHVEAVKKLHGALASLAGIGGPVHDMANKLKADMADLKAQIAGRAAEIQHSVYQFIENIKTAIGKLGDFMKPITDALHSVWQDFQGKLPDIKQMWQGMLEYLQKQIGIMSPQISTDMQHMVDDVGQIISNFQSFYDTHFGALKTISSTTVDFIVTYVATMITLLVGVVTVLMDILAGNWKGVWQTILDTRTTIMNQILALTGQDMASFVATWQGDLDLVQIIWNKFWSSFYDSWKGDWDLASIIFYKTINSIVNWLNTTAFNNFGDAGKNMMQGFINGIGSMVAALVNAAVSAAQKAIDAVKALLGVSSPSGVFIDIGRNTMLGMAIGIKGASGLPTAAISSAMGQVAGAVSNVSNVSNRSVQMTQNFYSANAQTGNNANYSLLRARVGI